MNVDVECVEIDNAKPKEEEYEYQDEGADEIGHCKISVMEGSEEDSDGDDENDRVAEETKRMGKVDDEKEDENIVEVDEGVAAVGSSEMVPESIQSDESLQEKLTGMERDMVIEVKKVVSEQKSEVDKATNKQMDDETTRDAPLNEQEIEPAKKKALSKRAKVAMKSRPVSLTEAVRIV